MKIKKTSQKKVMIDLIRLIIVTIIIDWDSTIHGLPAIIFHCEIKYKKSKTRKKHFFSIEK